MMPMKCPACGSSTIRLLITNNSLQDQTVRKRQCSDCGHGWFTVELAVPSYAVGWSGGHGSKPLLRAPVELTAKHVEPQDVALNLPRVRQAREDYGL